MSLVRKIGLTVLALLGLCIVGLYTVPNFPFGPYTLYGDMTPEQRAAKIPYSKLSNEAIRPFELEGRKGPFAAFADPIARYPNAQSCLVRSEQGKDNPDLRLIDWHTFDNPDAARICIWRLATSFESNYQTTLKRIKAWVDFHSSRTVTSENTTALEKLLKFKSSTQGFTGKDAPQKFPNKGIASIMAQIFDPRESIHVKIYGDGRIYNVNFSHGFK